MSAVLIFDTSGKIVSCFLAAVVHELGHLLCMLYFGFKPQYIKLTLFDVSIVSNEDKSFSQSLLISIFGIAFNFFFGIIFLPINLTFSLSNFAIGLFNALPVKSLDGGAVLSLIFRRKLSYKATERILFFLTLLFSVSLVLLGTLVLFYSRYNYSLLVIGLYLFSVLFVKQGEL